MLKWLPVVGLYKQMPLITLFPMFCVIASGKVVTKFYNQTPNYDLTFKLFSEVMFMVRQTKNTLKVLVYNIALTAKTFLYDKNLTTISKFETWSYRSLQVTRMIYIFSGGRQKSSGNNLVRKVIWRPPEVLRGSVEIIESFLVYPNP